MKFEPVTFRTWSSRVNILQ